MPRTTISGLISNTSRLSGIFSQTTDEMAHGNVASPFCQNISVRQRARH
jgi:hypothetical protein